MGESQQRTARKWARAKWPVLAIATLLLLAGLATSASAAPGANVMAIVSVQHGVAPMLSGPVGPMGGILTPGKPVPRSPFVPPAVPGRPPWGPGARPTLPPTTPPWLR